MEELLDFLKRWLAWAEASVLTNEFSPTRGLCGNALDHSDLAYDQLMEVFDKEFGENPYPFGAAEYALAAYDKKIHLCPIRRAWVKKTIKELEDNENG